MKWFCYTLHTVLLVIILIFIIAIICYHYTKHRPKLKKTYCEKKKYCRTKNIKIENNEFKKVRIKNCACYYLNNIIKFEDFDFDNVLIDEWIKWIFCFMIFHTKLVGWKPVHIRFDKVDGFIRVNVGIRYLVLFGLEKYDTIYSRIRYLVSLKSDFTYAFIHYYTKITVGNYDSLPLEKILTWLNVIMLIKSVFNKDQNHYYYNVFLEKCFLIV